MATADEKKFRKMLQARTFEPVYYFYGDEELLKEHAVRELISATVEPSTRDFNLDVRSAGALDGGTLGSLLGTPPMMSDRRVVVVREASALRKEARAALDAYVRAPSADLLLILIEPGGDRGKPDKSLATLPGALEFKPLTGDRLPRWVAHHAESVLGVSIEPDAAELLIAAVGSDLPSLAAELDKLASYTQGAAIDEAAVSAVVGVRRGETMGDLLGHIARRDAPAALGVLSHVLDQPKVSGVQIVMALTVQMLGLGYAHELLRDGLPRARLYTELFDFLKSGGGVLTGMSWGDAVKLWSGSVGRWDRALIDRALDVLRATDAALKQTTVSTEEQILSTAILQLCVQETAV